MEENYNLGQTPQGGFQYNGGIGYVAIPFDIDRAEYIAYCFKQGRVSIKTEDGGFINRCPISIDLLNWIVFPDKPEQNGSVVTWTLESVHKQPMINGILLSTDEINDLKENEFKIGRKFNDNFVFISGSPQKEYHSVVLKGVKKPKYIVRILNDDNNAERIEEIQGTTKTFTKKSYENSSNESIKHKVFKKNANENVEVEHLITAKGNYFKGEEFVINDGKEQMTLGNTLKDFLDELIDTIASSTVTTSIGQMPLLNASQISALKQKTENILSKIGKLD